jgi:phytoene synthase
MVKERPGGAIPAADGGGVGAARGRSGMTARSGPRPAAGAGSLVAEAHRRDQDRSLAALFAPPAARETLAALILLNHELARIPEIVHEPMAGMIRYQWWRDGIEAVTRAEPTGHPTLDALRPALADGRIGAADLMALVDAREHDLDTVPPEDLRALEAYAAATSGRLHELLLRALGCGDLLWLGDAVDIGTAIGLVWLVRAVGFHARQSRLYLPERLMSEAGVSRQEVLAAQASERLGRVTGRIVERGEALIAGVRRHGPPPRQWLPALLAARAASSYARRLRRRDFDPFAASATERPPAVALSLVLGGLAGRL